MIASILATVPATTIDAILYGFFGAVTGALGAWLISKRLWGKPLHDAHDLADRLVAELREHTDATEMLARNLGDQTQHLATIADHLSSTTIKQPTKQQEDYR